MLVDFAVVSLSLQIKYKLTMIRVELSWKGSSSPNQNRRLKGLSQGQRVVGVIILPRGRSNRCRHFSLDSEKREKVTLVWI